MANIAYKFRIYPNSEQEVMFVKTFGCARFVYNYFLQKIIEQYEKDKTRLTYTKCAKMMAEMKRMEKFSYLKEVDSISLQQSLRHLDSAFSNFFKIAKIKFPRFKSKKDTKKSYSTVCVNGNITISNEGLRLPKIGEVKIKQHRIIPSHYTLKSVTISKTASGKYYASILFEYENQVTSKEQHSFLGLDFCMNGLYKDSNGECANYPKHYRKAECKLKKEQRKLSLMEKGSKNRNKQRIKVAKLHERVANCRKDFLHKLSRKIVNTCDCVCIEDLDMKAMAQALNFGKSVCDNAWGMFTAFLNYKLEQAGKVLVKVDRFFASSKTCSKCGYVNKEIKNLAIRSWTCPNCGIYHDRDTNAAINIRNEGMRIIGALI